MNNTINIAPLTSDGYFLGDVSSNFESGAEEMMKNLQDAEAQLEADPSNPQVLAKYQAVLQEYQLFRNAQTTTVAAYKKVGETILQNFR